MRLLICINLLVSDHRHIVALATQEFGKESEVAPHRYFKKIEERAR